MADTDAVGYPTDIGDTNIDWAQMQWGLGARYWVRADGDLQVTPKTDGTRQVNISVGYGGGCGVVDHLTATKVVTLPTVTSGTRWFLIVARRNWNTGSVGTTFTYIDAGTSASALPTLNVDGVTAGGTGLDDQPLAMVPLTAGDTVPGTPIDVRVIGASARGILLAKSELALQYQYYAGQVVKIGNTTFTRLLDGSWDRDPDVVRSGPGYGNPLGVASGGTGWATVSELVSKGTRSGNERQLLLVARKSGGDIVIGAAGSVSGGDLVAVSVSNTDWRPPHDLPFVGFEYVSNATAGSTPGTFGGTARSWSRVGPRVPALSE